MPAYCQAYSIDLRDLRDRFMFWPHGLNLNDPKDVAGFMEAVGDFAPDIIIIDTLAQVTPGVDSNSSLKGDIFGYSGPLGAMRQAWDSLVIMNCHPPKSNPRDILGHSSIVGNTDAVLINEYDRDAGLITVTVERYKHGPEGGKLYFKVDPTQLPVPRMIPESEVPEKSGSGDEYDKPSFDSNEALGIRTVLSEYDLTSREMKINNRRMAELLTPQGGTGDMQKTWKQRVEKKLKQLKNIQTNKVGKPGCPFTELTEQDEVGHWWWWDRGFVSAKTVRDQFPSLFDSQPIGSA
jgi:hypothetical protein